MTDPIDRTGLRPRFWETTPLSRMTRREWEALCDGCGKCCLNKLEDDETGEVALTRVACRLFDDTTCRCAQPPASLRTHRTALPRPGGPLGLFATAFESPMLGSVPARTTEGGRVLAVQQLNNHEVLRWVARRGGHRAALTVHTLLYCTVYCTVLYSGTGTVYCGLTVGAPGRERGSLTEELTHTRSPRVARRGESESRLSWRISGPES